MATTSTESKKLENIGRYTLSIHTHTAGEGERDEAERERREKYFERKKKCQLSSVLFSVAG